MKRNFDKWMATFKTSIAANLFLKQGYYSYQYLAMDTDGRIHRLASEGNFFQTQNTYRALVYYKGNADRAWRLVGRGEIKTGS